MLNRFDIANAALENGWVTTHFGNRTMIFLRGDVEIITVWDSPPAVPIEELWTRFVGAEIYRGGEQEFASGVSDAVTLRRILQVPVEQAARRP